MFRKDSSTYVLEEKGPRHQRRNSMRAILACLLGVGVVCSILFVPRIQAQFRKIFSSWARPAFNPRTVVWTNKDGGIYYCPGSPFYGSGSGLYMKQGDALTAGYQPALGTYCIQEGPGAHPRASHNM